jgi:hypothetical protein
LNYKVSARVCKVESTSEPEIEKKKFSISAKFKRQNASRGEVIFVIQNELTWLKHYIFFVTYKWALQDRVFVLSKTFQPSVM